MGRGHVIPKAHELDDGAVEAVSDKPRRKRPTGLSAKEAVAGPVGGKMARMRAAGAEARQEFAMIRGPLGVAKVALPHLVVFNALWRLWAAKRALGQEPGVSAAEIVEATQRPLSSVRATLTTLLRSGIVRSVRTSIGWANVKASYFPTELGTQILGIAQMLGAGASVQVGHTPVAWKSRNASEPENFFRHAEFLRGSI